MERFIYMAKKNKGEIKINKKHEGKEFSNSFHFVGKVKPVQKMIKIQIVGMMLKSSTLTKRKLIKTVEYYSLLLKQHLKMNLKLN